MREIHIGLYMEDLSDLFAGGCVQVTTESGDEIVLALEVADQPVRGRRRD